MDNFAIARALRELADAIELSTSKRGGEAYKARAFRSAAKTIEELGEPAEVLLARGDLKKVPGIGAGTEKRVAELVARGDLAELEAKRSETPPGLAELVRVPGLGRKTADALWRELGIGDVDALYAAAKDGRLANAKGFGVAKAKKIVEAVERAREAPEAANEKLPFTHARPIAESFAARLRSLDASAQVEVAGEVRRRVPFVDEVAFVAALPEASHATFMSAASALPDVLRVVARAATTMSVVLRDGLRAELFVVKPADLGAALLIATGARAHVNEVLARLASKRVAVESLAGADERAVYSAAGLAWVPPELREGRGEIDLAARDALPRLIDLDDLVGDLHMHTVETDGKSTLEEMATAARALGRSYIAITDHSRALAMARGLDPERLAAQGRAIAELNDKLGGSPIVLRGIEADILADGSVDLGSEVLGELDWVIGSVHSHFAMPREEMTARVVKALESGSIDCLGHPTGRIIRRRRAYSIDLERVLRAAERSGAAVELNSFPSRLDLDEEGLTMARELGVMVAIDSDAHHTRQLTHLQHAIPQARRAWLEPKHVVNAMSIDALRARFGRARRVA